MPIPTAVPADAAAQLPKARMIDPRGHRFGAGASAILLIVAFLTGTVALVALALLSIAVSAAFGLNTRSTASSGAGSRRSWRSPGWNPSTSTRRGSPRPWAAPR